MLVKSANSRCSRALINSCLAETEAVHADDDLRSGQLYELFMKKMKNQNQICCLHDSNSYALKFCQANRLNHAAKQPPWSF